MHHTPTHVIARGPVAFIVLGACAALLGCKPVPRPETSAAGTHDGSSTTATPGGIRQAAAGPTQTPPT